MVLDIVFILILVLFFINGFKHGFMKTLFGFIGFVASAVVAFILFKPVSEAIKKMPVAMEAIKGMTDAIATAITPAIGGKVEVPAALSGIFQQGSIDNAIKSGTGQASTAMAGFVADVAILILIIIAVKLAINIVIYLTSIITKLPGLNILDRALGGALGLVYGTLAVYFFCAALQVYSVASKFNTINDMLRDSRLAPIFYTQNVLIHYLLKKPHF